jgi:PAS domain-containing protein
MRELPIQFLDQGLHRVLFDAMPMPVFVVDADVSVLEYNSAAARLLGGAKGTVLRKKGGEILRCVHSNESPGGCGHGPACADCLVRRMVREAFAGREVVRESAQMELLAGGKRKKVRLQVSTRQFNYDEHSYVLLMLDGLGH